MRLEWFTVGWNVVEGVVAVVAASAAGSVALFGFGIDSFVESTSGGILIWRLRAERRLETRRGGARGSGAAPAHAALDHAAPGHEALDHEVRGHEALGQDEFDHEAIEQLDRRAHRLVALSLIALAAWITFDASHALGTGERPEPSAVGMALTAVSLRVMAWLARAKRRTAAALGSRALASDSFQTTACWWLSLVTLSGIALNAAFGWWWADPAAALAIAALVVREGLEAWRGDSCCT